MLNVYTGPLSNSSHPVVKRTLTVYLWLKLRISSCALNNKFVLSSFIMYINYYPVKETCAGRLILCLSSDDGSFCSWLKRLLFGSWQVLPVEVGVGGAAAGSMAGPLHLASGGLPPLLLHLSSGLELRSHLQHHVDAGTTHLLLLWLWSAQFLQPG